MTTNKPHPKFKRIVTAMEDLKTIPGLFEFVMENCFVAGGAVRDCARDIDPKDYDVYFKSEAIKNYFIKQFETKIHKTPLGNYNLEVKNTIQFITLETGTPNQIIANFDWNVNQLYYDFKNPPSEYQYIYTPTTLSFNCDCKYPLSAILRLPYLLSKGFIITPSEFGFAMAYIANIGVLNSPEAAQKAMLFQPSGNLAVNMFRTTERALEAVTRQSPLGKAMSENEGTYDGSIVAVRL